MYIPYVRGKQFELLALKEYASSLGQSGSVRPLIEPVKDPNTSRGLDRCLQSLVSAGVQPLVAINPLVGELAGQSPEVVLSFLADVDPTNRISAAVLVHQDTTPIDVAALLAGVQENRSVWLVHLAKSAHLDALSAAVGARLVSHVIPADARPRLYKMAFPGNDLSILADGFPNQARNADYLPLAASEFSDDVLYYEDEGFVGFGDYLTVGSGWAEGGFTPRAVAIHWTYQEPSGGPIMIRHFVSNSNGDISNVGGKYLEAVQKLVEFLPSTRVATRAGEVFKESLASSSYPGLGIVKKLSMQNHLEVIMRAMSPE